MINQIKFKEGKKIDNKYIKFTIKNDQYKINIFFDNKTKNLIGWQTEDLYQNLVITFISSLNYNRNIMKKF